MSDSSPLFTVFTPTYNRAHTLVRVYQCLVAQTLRDFEWLVVDDGSSDGTPALLAGWQAEGRVPIRYVCQPNGGKHVAFNTGVRLARGALFLTLDSDDSCDANALQRLHGHWLSIATAERSAFSGVTCLCKTPSGQIVGSGLPRPLVDGLPFQVFSQLRLHGEMWGFQRTDLLRRFPYPEFAGERFVPEGLVWNRIGAHHKIRFVNEALRHYHHSADGLSMSTVRLRLASPRAAVTFYGELMNLPVRLRDRVRAAANLGRFAVGGRVWHEALPHLRRHPAIAVLGLPIGLCLALKDRASGLHRARSGAARPAATPLREPHPTPPADPHA